MDKIALIDNNTEDRVFIKTLLSKDYSVISFSSFSEFSESVVNFDVQLIVTDTSLALNRFFDFGKSSGNSIPVIQLIENDDVISRDGLVELVATDFVRRPIHGGILLHRIALLLNLSKQTKRAESAQTQLFQSEKLAALGQLAAGVAHEINNPVGFVTSNTNLTEKYVERIESELKKLEADCAEDESGAALLTYTRWKSATKLFQFMSDLRDISTESLEGLNRIREIVKDLKDYAHVGDMKFEQTDINQLLSSSINLLRNEIKYKAEVITELEEIPLISCIPSQINQVFVNIIVNACHAIEEFGTITIATKLIGEKVSITLQDTGKGIPKDIIKKVFDPFFTTKPVGKGTGIGLAITRSIIDRHHGDIKVSSIEGTGTEFRIFLPIEQSQEETIEPI
ncbi:sensor histidine kinase [Reinekea sp. G2M2-21]|uniref:sensor histidine kinase n=1 Tax=Reinekea sp. G2M2-21 TaxID=2788942 RepID=UPI0018ABD12A|nr:ATP-binding protein [Reinekea sp. G2M2-21]